MASPQLGEIQVQPSQMSFGPKAVSPNQEQFNRVIGHFVDVPHDQINEKFLKDKDLEMKHVASALNAGYFIQEDLKNVL